MEKIGLVLEGGGMRGFYTAGVLDFFMDHNLEVDGVIGVSAGACHAVSYISKQRGRNYRMNIKYINDRRYMSLRNFITTGDVVGADFLYNVLPNQLDLFDYKAFYESKTKLYAVVSNVETGKAEYKQIVQMKQDIPYIRASASLPLLSRIVEIDGKKYLDGGTCDSIPVKKFQEMGYQKNIVVLTQCKDYRKGKNSLMPMIKRVYKHYPEYIKANEDRHIHYNECLKELNEMEKRGEIFIFRPSTPVEISRLEKNKTKLKALYEQGYEDAKKNYDKLIAFLEKKQAD